MGKREEERIARNVLRWLNTFPEIPKTAGAIRYESLSADRTCMALSTIPGTYITAWDIVGGYEAEYRFAVFYRVKPGGSDDKSLKADELLEGLAAWASSQPLCIGEEIDVQKVEPTSRAAIFAQYENGDEDHQIFMKLTYQSRA